MANKKISQLNMVDGAVGITSADLFPIASGGGGGGYQTASVTSLDVASFCLAPMPANQLNQPIGFTGNVNFNIKQSSSAQINFDKDNWATAGVGESFPYLQVDLDNGGKLVTGSGISVPAIADNMGNCVATTTLNMQANWLSGSDFSVTGVNDIYFNSSSETYGPKIEKGDDPGEIYDLKVQAGQDLTLSGIRYVNISGQALSLEDGDTQTPISGNVIITGGNVEIDPANKLIVNEITITKDPGFSSGVLSIEGASYHDPNRADYNGGDVYWDYSNIQFCECNPLDDVFPTYAFQGVANGQTLTMYIRSTRTSGITPDFTHTTNVPVVWGAEYSNTAPELESAKTNLYTFVRINTGIFASAVTGYVY